MAVRFRTKELSVYAQGVGLKRLFPDSKLKVGRKSLIWETDITPTPLSNTYTVQLQYKLEESPKLYVLKPKLIVPEGERLPHAFSGARLCLYYPGVGEWKKDKALSMTIVPWISEWLLHYEIWLATGQWCGGGIHLPKKEKNDG